MMINKSLQYSLVVDSNGTTELNFPNNLTSTETYTVKPPWTIFLYTLVLFMTLCGNIIVCIVVYRLQKSGKTRRLGRQTQENSSMYVLVINLAIADIGCAVLSMPFSIALAAVPFEQHDVPHGLCILMCLVHRIFLTASVVTLTVISINRYIVLCHGDKEFHTKFAICAIWMVTIINTVLPLINYDGIVVNEDITICDSIYTNVVEQEADFFILTSIYLICVVILIFCYINVFRVIRKTIKECQVMGVRADGCLMERKLARMFLVCVLLFFICWTPLIVFMVLLDAVKIKAPDHLGAFAIWAGYANSACNPLVYCLASERYRKEVIKMLREMCFALRSKIFGKRKVRQGSHSQFYVDSSELDDFLGGCNDQMNRTSAILK